MLDPREPNSPTPAADKEYPLTITASVLWFVATLFGTLLLLGITQAVRPEASKDLVNAVVCQVLAYLLVVFLALRVHGGDRSLGQVLGLRRTHPLFYVLAPLLGASLQVPAEVLQRWLLARWPDSPEMIASQAQMLRMDTTLLRIMVPLAAVVLGPIVEEVFFRGTLTWGLRRRYGDLVTVLVVAALFAGAHTSFKLFAIYFLLGAALTYLRVASGSVVPAILAHIAFNGVAVVGLLVGLVSLGASQAPLPMPVAVFGVGTTVVVLGLIWALKRRSVLASTAQSKDLE